VPAAPAPSQLLSGGNLPPQTSGPTGAAAGQFQEAQPGPNETLVRSLVQEKEGPWYRLRGAVQLETSAILLKADEAEYNEETAEVRARGNVYFRDKERGDELWAESLEYDVNDETGTFLRVRGISNPKIEARPRTLTTSNPFYFEGQWAERLKEKYILHQGFVTNCKLPNPWWKLHGARFDIIPDRRAIASKALLRLKGVPLLYTPAFYKSLERLPRRSGFLSPNVGNSSRYGLMFGIGYYWAINRSYDLTYRPQIYTDRGVAHTVDFRGKPAPNADFYWYIYGVNDRGRLLESGERKKEGGFIVSFDGRSDLGRGWYARGDINYVSSFLFRQSFTQSYNEAINSEVHSVGAVSRHWSSFSLDLAYSQVQNFLSTEQDDSITIRKAPSVEFASRDRRVWRSVPVWVSLESSAGFLRREQPLYQTRQFVDRIDIAPRIMSKLYWKGFHFVPSLLVRETFYGEQRQGSQVITERLRRDLQEFDAELSLPPLARVFRRPSWLGDQVKHVIEPRVSFRYARGVADFNQTIRFDETELFSNTNEAEISLTNRVYAKRNGSVREVLSWQLWQRRYFDPDFGGAIIPGRRNVVTTSAAASAFAFLDRPRSYSPIVSALRVSPLHWLGAEWRADYDPLRGRMVNGILRGDARWSIYFISLGHNFVQSVPTVPAGQYSYLGLSPNANQIIGFVGIGKENRRGWNAGFSAIYDFRKDVMQFATTQVTYNTDCCGFRIQYRRFNVGTRNENQIFASFAIANIGSFGTLRRHESFF